MLGYSNVNRKQKQMLGLGTPELALILLIGLFLFGGKKLPELAHSVGTAAKELKKGFHEEPKNETKKSETHPGYSNSDA